MLQVLRSKILAKPRRAEAAESMGPTLRLIKFSQNRMERTSQDVRKEHFRVIMPLAKLADTWNEHFRKAVGLFQKCGMMLLYFSPSDPAFLQMKDAYSWKPERPLLNLLGLGYGDASDTLYYRVKGFTETKEQSVPLVVTVAVDGDKCPHGVLVPFTPTQSHP